MSGFWIDVYDGAGVKENGTTINVSDVQLSEKANRIGQVSFTLPAVDALTIAAVYGKRYRLYSSKNGYIGQFRHRSISVDADGRTASITADDSLLDLANMVVGFNQSYTGTNLGNVIYTLAFNAGWTVAFEPGVASYLNSQDINLEFQGESYLTALDFVRNYVRGWFRRSGDTEITFGRFRDLGFQNTYYNQSTRVATDGTVVVVPTKYGDATWAFKYNGNQAAVLDSEIDAYLTNPPIASDYLVRSTQYTKNDGTLAGLAPYMSTITALSKEVDGTSVVNRVIPRGSGQGITAMDLRYSTWSNSPFEIQYDVAGDYYFIEDVQSQALYGVVTRVLPFSEVRPITNSPADLIAAGNALYALSVAYLRKFRAPFEVYRVQCVNLPETAEIGSVVLIDFRGVATMPNGDTAWLTIDRTPFFIIEKTTRWTESGEASYDLVVSSNGEGNISTTDIFKNALEEIRKFQARPEPTITYYHNSNPTLPVQAYYAADSSFDPPTPEIPKVDISFPFTLDRGVLLINAMTIEMKVTRFTTYGVSTIRADAFTVGLPPSGQKTTESQDTSIGTSATLKTEADPSGPGGSTSLSGGGSSPTTTSASPFHSHTFGVIADSSGSPVYLQGGFLHSTGGGWPDSSSSATTHDHLVNIPAHSHSFPLPSHVHGMAHTHPLPGHVHLHDHVHALDPGIISNNYGVFQSPTLPGDILVTFNGMGDAVPITGWTVIQNEDNASTDGTLCAGAGLFRADIVNMFPAPGGELAKDYEIRVSCEINGGLVFCRLLGRVTVQPISV